MKILFAFLLISITLISNLNGATCACCAEKGQYTLSVRKPDNYEIGELRKLKISETTLYTDAGYPETIKGITPVVENFTANFIWQKTSWSFKFINEQNAEGILNLANSTTMTDFRTDLYDREGDPLLYKELRFKSKVLSGTGIFKKGIASGTTYFLVFQGRGNNCMNAEDFTHWRLEVSGKRADYAFFGKLAVKE